LKEFGFFPKEEQGGRMIKSGEFFTEVRRLLPGICFWGYCLGFFCFPDTLRAVESYSVLVENQNVSEVRLQWKDRTVNQWEAVLKAGLEKKAPSIPEQWYAAYALGEYGEAASSVVPVMLERLAYEAGKDDDVRACLLFSLGKIGDESAFPAMVEAFNSEYPIIERTAALTLGVFPEKLKAEGALVLEKMERILKERSPLQIPMAVNCAVTLWGVGEKEKVEVWLEAALFSDREDAFTRDFEVYQAISAIRQIESRYGADGLNACSFENGLSLAESLVGIVQSSSDLDVRLNASETLGLLGNSSIEPLRKIFENGAGLNGEKKVEPRLLEVLAQLDAEHKATQELLFGILKNRGEDALQVSAVRGMLFLPIERREEAVSALVELLNDAEISGAIVTEARLALKKLQKP